MNLVNFYGKSLRYGCSSIYQSMPRMLSVWLDFGTSVAEMEKDRDRTREKLEMITNMRKSLDKMTKIIGKQIKFHFKQHHCVSSVARRCVVNSCKQGKVHPI